MAKKLTPSGYQIINIDVTDKTSGVGFTPETDDEKILYEICSKTSECKKPTLLNLVTTDRVVQAFAIYHNGDIIIQTENFSESFYVEDGKLVWLEVI